VFVNVQRHLQEFQLKDTESPFLSKSQIWKTVNAS